MREEEGGEEKIEGKRKQKEVGREMSPVLMNP